MIEISMQDIRQRAHELAEAKKPWHFHMLSPTCMFNTQNEWAHVLEDTDGNQVYVHYAPEALKDLGKELLGLLHGADVIKKESYQDKGMTPDSVKLLERAQKLTDEGVAWHHHVLFPACAFNTGSGKWTLTLEDPQTNEVLKSHADHEPKEELKFIESLFYKQ